LASPAGGCEKEKQDIVVAMVISSNFFMEVVFIIL
jgi:hypothetical protein